jgi:NAD(P)H-dependent flavin oxidoreductase YrpB (nitropropane dioxygenase family)
MKIPQLRIGNLEPNLPIVQGGMGVRVSLASLASAVSNEGGIGTISSIGLGDIDGSAERCEATSREALLTEIRKAKRMTNSHIAVNFMGVISNVDDLIKAAVDEGVRLVVFGAGLPVRLPSVVQDPDVSLLPIVSCARAAELILRTWDRRYSMTAAGFILEGPLAGGHLGFSPGQLQTPGLFSLEKTLPEVLEAVKPYEDKYGRKIPIITAGGIYTGKDIARMLSLGASGVQMGTRFVCTEECDASPEFKEAYLRARKEDIVIIESPVGMPGRAINNQFLRGLSRNGKKKVKCPYRCLTSCKAKTAKYCIARALLNSHHGDIDNGLVFCGQNAYRATEIVTVRELFEELLSELQEA